MTAMPRRRASIAAAGALVAAIAVAFVLDDVAHVACFAPGIERGALGLVVVAGCAGLATAANARSARNALVAAITSSALFVLLVRSPSTWLDLGPFGAGPFTALTVIVVPITVLAGTLSAAAIAAITRGASRTRPSSRPPSLRR